MNILVCLKQILDPEIPPRDFRVDSARKEADRGSAGLVMNIFCANALEIALQLREKHGGKITVLSFGPEGAEEMLRKALALRADTAVLVSNDRPNRPNPWVVARTLSAAIRKLGTFDLVLTGRESGDWGDGQTGGLLAEELGWPCVSFADQLEVSPANPAVIRARRQTDDGWEMIEAAAPLVATITNNDRNVPRVAKTRDVMQAFRLPLTRLSLADLGLDATALSQAASASEVVDLSIPRKETKCEFITGDTIQHRIAGLAQKIAAVMQSA